MQVSASHDPVAPLLSQPHGVLDGLPLGDLRRLRDAGEEVGDCLRVLARSGETLVGELARDQGPVTPWTRFPEDGAYDPEHGAQYFFHRHDPPGPGGGHGHFHTFARPQGTGPASHLAAISLDEAGQPTALFTVNRWVTDEHWRDAVDAKSLIDQFRVDLVRPSWLVNRWISAMVAFFAPQIAVLLEDRDRALARFRARYPEGDPLEDRRLEVVSMMEISIAAHLKQVRAAVRASRRNR